MAEGGESFFRRVIKRLEGKSTFDSAPNPEPGTTTPTAQRLDEASRTFGFRGNGSPRMTPPTEQGLARAQEATPPTPPTEPTQGK